MATMTLTERVYQAFSEEHVGSDMLEVSMRQPGEQPLSQFELDLRDWGVAFGVAYALARTEANTFEPHEAVAERAYEAAWAAWTRYAAGFHKRELDEQAEKLALRWLEARGGVDESADGEPDGGYLPSDLRAQLDDLAERAVALEATR